MTRSIKQTLAAWLIGALVLPAAALAQSSGQQQSGETVKSKHGAWEVVCSTEQPDLCVIRQFGVAGEGNRVLEVRVRKLDGVTTQDGQNVPAAIRVLTPLGTLIQPGLTVQVDAAEPRTGVFEVCLPQGCIVEDPMSEEFLGRLKAGAVAKMTFGIVQQQEPINVELSLNGFTKAFSAL